MTSIAVDTPTMRALAQRVQRAVTAVTDLERAWCAVDSCGAEFSGHVRPVADALRELTSALADETHGSLDDLDRLQDSIVVLAGVWESGERFAGIDGAAE
jgi:hypothetical protein